MNKQWIGLILLAPLIGAAVGCQSDASHAATPAKLEWRNFTPQWTAELRPDKNDPITDVFVRDKTLFVYTKSHVVYSVERSSGKIQSICHVMSGARLFAPVVVGDNVVYASNDRLELYDNKGNFVRTIDLAAAIRSGAGTNGRYIFLGADYPNGGRLLAIDLVHQYKPVRWELMTMGGISSAPAVFQGVIYAASEDGKVYAVSEERAAVWPMEGGTFQTSGRIIADVKADDYGVYVASTDSKLYCLNRASGKIRWQYFAEHALDQAPSVTSDFVYLPANGIAAINKTDGKYNRVPKWTVPDAKQFVAEDEKYAYLAQRDGGILAVEKNSGESKFTSQGKFIAFGTNTKDGTIYAVTPDGNLVAAKPAANAGMVAK